MPLSSLTSSTLQSGIPPSTSAKDIAEGPGLRTEEDKACRSGLSGISGVISATVQEDLVPFIEMQQELSDVLRRLTEACTARVRHMEAILSPCSLDLVDKPRPGGIARCGRASEGSDGVDKKRARIDDSDTAAQSEVEHVVERACSVDLAIAMPPGDVSP